MVVELRYFVIQRLNLNDDDDVMVMELRMVMIDVFLNALGNKHTITTPSEKGCFRSVC